MEEKNFSDCFLGSATVGDRGQIVIPAEARALLGIQAGDKLLLLRDPVHRGLVVTKFEWIDQFLDQYRKDLHKLNEITSAEETL